MKKTPLFVLLLAVLLLPACNLTSANPSALATPILPRVGLGIQAQSGAGFNAPGQVIQYNYTVTNTGTTRLAGPVTVLDAKISVICPDVATVGNKDSYLDPAESLICTGSYSVTQADIAAGQVTNTATASIAGTLSDPAIGMVRAAENKVLVLTKTATPANFSQAGQVITFNYVITNTGGAALGPTQFTITDDHLPAPLSCGLPDTSLAQNQTVICTAMYTTTAADVAAGQVTSSATASGGGATTGGIATNTLTLTGAGAGAGQLPSGSSLSPGTTLQYKVVQGEWIIQIARCFGADPKAIAQSNTQIKDPNEIDPGEILTIPNIGSKGRVYGPPCIGTHTVQAGDTWSSIALKYNADVDVLRAANEDEGLTAGNVLRIPLNSAGGAVGTVPTAIVTPIVTACNQAQMVADVNMPDGTAVTAGANFTKTWRLKNVGTCTWTSAYALVFDHGESMGAPASMPLTTTSVPPGGTVDLSIPLRAPATAGTYQGDFRLRAADGVVFGIGANGQGSFWVKIVVTGTAAATAIPTASLP